MSARLQRLVALPVMGDQALALDHASLDPAVARPALVQGVTPLPRPA